MSMLTIISLAPLLAVPGSAAGLQQPSGPARQPDPPTLTRPQWQVGDRWVVETQTYQDQVAFSGPRRLGRPLQWQFHVAATEQVQGEACWRIEVRCITSGVVSGPVTLWCSRRTMALRRLRAEIPSRDGPRILDELYQPGSAGPRPTLTPLRVVPCDLPAFTLPEAKGLATFRFSVLSGPAGRKSIDRFTFSYEVSQQIDLAPANAKDMAHQQFAKSVETAHLVAVTLRSGPRQVRQYWQPGVPWPVVARNETTVSRLVKVHRAGPQQKAAPQPGALDRPRPAERQPNQLRQQPAARDQGPGRSETGAKDDEPAAAQPESGRASYSPWSGWWWPYNQGGLTEPLTKYDRHTGSQASVWERQHHADPSAPGWHGHCHNWAAAAVMEYEPQNEQVMGDSGLRFTVGDQKGLITACHGQDVANSYGDRFGDGQGSEDPADLPPDELWRLLRAYVGDLQVPLVIDTEAGPEVWNYPVYAYELTSTRAGPNHLHCELTVSMVAPSTTREFRGLRTAAQSYTFTVAVQNGQVVMGSGRWTGDSVQKHPDFAWYPYVSAPENPYVDAKKVSQLVGYRVGGQTAPPPGPGPGIVEHRRPPRPERPEMPPPAVETLMRPEQLLALLDGRTSHWRLDITVDRFDGGTYRPGEPLHVVGSTERPGFLYLFHLGPNRELLQVLWPPAGRQHQVPATSLFRMPPGHEPLVTVARPGRHTLVGLITERPLALTGPAPGSATQAQQEAAQRPRPAKQQQRQAPPQQHPAGQAHKARPQPAKTTPAAGQTPSLEQIGPFARDECLFFVTTKKLPTPRSK